MVRTLIQNRKSNYYITTSQFAEEGVLFAASQLKHYLSKAGGIVFPYWSDRRDKACPEIRVGPNVRGHREDVSMLGEEGFLIKTDGEDIVITGKTARGVIYGVYRFLELTIGFRCFTKEVERYNTVDTLTVDELNLFENPAFEYRDTYFRGAFDGGFAVKNHLNSTLAMIPHEQGGKMKFFNLHHSFFDILPPQTYFADHPEWYSERDGVRNYENAQLCLTNEDAIQEAIKNVRNWIVSRPDCKVFSVAQNDNQRFCTCENCRAADEKEGSPSGCVIYFVNRIAEALETEFPHVLFHTFAYQYSKKAPAHIRPHRNVIVRLCNIECSFYKPFEEQFNFNAEGTAFLNNVFEWSKICKHLYLWEYACNFAYYLLPFPNYRALAKNLKLYQKNGVMGVLEQGNFSYGCASGLAELESYLCAKLLWNPDCDADELIREFTDGCYGKAAGYMRAYIQEWQDVIGDDAMIFCYRPHAIQRIDDAFVTRLELLFEKAFAVADNDEIRTRLKRESLAVDFLKIARLPVGSPERDELIDALYEDVVSLGITEIFERIELDASFELLRKFDCKTGYGNLLAPASRLYYIIK